MRAETVVWGKKDPQAGTGPKEPSRVGRTEEAFQRRARLLRKLLQGRDAAEIAREEKRALRRDLEAFDDTFAEIAEWLDFFGLPAPDIQKSRGFVRVLNRDNATAKQQLARDAVHLKCSDQNEQQGDPYLVPRNATAFWGIGATTYFAMKELIENGYGPQQSVITSSFEIAMQLYANVPKTAPGGKPPQLSLLNYRVDRTTGGAAPHTSTPEQIPVAVVSFDVMDQSGAFWSQDEPGYRVTNDYLARTSSRIVILGDCSKMKAGFAKGASDFRLEIPQTKDDLVVFLVTDKPLPPDFKLQPGIQLVVVDEVKATYQRGIAAAASPSGSDTQHNERKQSPGGPDNHD